MRYCSREESGEWRVEKEDIGEGKERRCDGDFSGSFLDKGSGRRCRPGPSLRLLFGGNLANLQRPHAPSCLTSLP
jgi:hypothetical protein